MNIRRWVYEGRDYLPALYKKLLPTHQGYVATLNGKMVRKYKYYEEMYINIIFI